jgi:hypothetical protein
MHSAGLLKTRCAKDPFVDMRTLGDWTEVDRMYEHGSLPRARQDGLLEEAVGEELLLYDQDSHTAHCLSPIAACVWRHCDGEHDLAGLAQLVGASEDLVAGALHELLEKELLDTEPALTQSTIPGESRREAIVRTARYGAAAAAGSMIVSATAATPAMAESTNSTCCQCKTGNTRTACTTTAVTCCQTGACNTACNNWCTGQGYQEGFCVNTTCTNNVCV